MILVTCKICQLDRDILSNQAGWPWRTAIVKSLEIWSIFLNYCFNYSFLFFSCNCWFHGSCGYLTLFEFQNILKLWTSKHLTDFTSRLIFFYKVLRYDSNCFLNNNVATVYTWHPHIFSHNYCNAIFRVVILFFNKINTLEWFSFLETLEIH